LLLADDWSLDAPAFSCLLYNGGNVKYRPENDGPNIKAEETTGSGVKPSICDSVSPDPVVSSPLLPFGPSLSSLAFSFVPLRPSLKTSLCCCSQFTLFQIFTAN